MAAPPAVAVPSEAVRSAFLEAVRASLPDLRLLTDPVDRESYRRDETAYLSTGLPLAVALPANTAEVSGLVRLAAQHRIPIVPRGAGSGLSGGAAGIDVAADRDDVAMIATLAAPATLATVGDDEQALLQRLRNIGVIHDPNFPPDPTEWWADLVGGAAENAIGRISPRPILLIHGDADQIVPYPHAETLFDRAGEPKELVRIPGGAHQLRRDPRALDALTDWLDRRLARRGAGHSGQVAPQM